LVNARSKLFYFKYLIMKDLHSNVYSAPQAEVIRMDEEVAVCQASKPTGYDGNSWGSDF